jgi:hypothetical protein
MAPGQDIGLAATMAFIGCHEADRTMPVFPVVPDRNGPPPISVQPHRRRTAVAGMHVCILEYGMATRSTGWRQRRGEGSRTAPHPRPWCCRAWVCLSECSTRSRGSTWWCGRGLRASSRHRHKFCSRTPFLGQAAIGLTDSSRQASRPSSA